MKKYLFLIITVLLTVNFAFSQGVKDNNYEAVFDVNEYVISIDSINTSTKQFYANTEIKVVAVENTSDDLLLDLLYFTVDSVFVDGVLSDDYVSTDSTLSIGFSNDLYVGDEVDCKVFYHGEPYCDDWGGVNFEGEYVYNLGVSINAIPHNMGRAWFPCVDNFVDKAKFEYFVRVPEEKTAVCGGELVDVTDNEDGSKIYHYKTDLDIATYAASFAVGDYETVTDVHHGIAADIPITYTVKANAVNVIPTMFQNIHAIINLYESKFGAYPFERIGYTSTSKGAMEHQNNIAFPHSCFTNNLSYESLYAHELFHSWFGNMITCASAEDMWINEGWATFVQYYYQEVLYGRDVYMELIESAKSQVLSTAHTASQDGGYYALNKIPQTNTYGVSAYEKGALVVHSMRHFLGDELFFETVKKVIENNPFSSMSSEQFCAALTAASGVDMNDFFLNYVYQGGASAYSVDSCLSQQIGNKWEVDVYMQQKIMNRSFISNSNKVDVTFMDDNLNTETKTMFFDGKTGNSTFEINVEPKYVFVNQTSTIYDAMYNREKMIYNTGLSTINSSRFKLSVEEVSDSAYFHVSNYLVEPSDRGKVKGYRLSNSHYWKIDFVPFGNFLAKGLFNYSKSTLDGDLLINPDDEPVLVYRQTSSDAWVMLPTTKYGNISIGDLMLDTLRCGEYSLAVADSTINEINDYENVTDNCMSVYPNPSSNVFNIKIDNINAKDKLYVYNIKGSKIDELPLTADADVIEWHPESYQNNSTYFFVLQKSDGQRIVKKAIYLK